MATIASLSYRYGNINFLLKRKKKPTPCEYYYIDSFTSHRVAIGKNSEFSDINQNSTQFDKQRELAIYWTKEFVADGEKKCSYTYTLLVYIYAWWKIHFFLYSLTFHCRQNVPECGYTIPTT